MRFSHLITSASLCALSFAQDLSTTPSKTTSAITTMISMTISSSSSSSAELINVSAIESAAVAIVGIENDPSKLSSFIQDLLPSAPSQINTSLSASPTSMVSATNQTTSRITETTLGIQPSSGSLSIPAPLASSTKASGAGVHGFSAACGGLGAVALAVIAFL